MADGGHGMGGGLSGGNMGGIPSDIPSDMPDMGSGSIPSDICLAVLQTTLLRRIP